MQKTSVREKIDRHTREWKKYSRELKNIALTGCIGSGKSLVCNVFEHLGIPVFISDQRAKDCYKDSSFLQQIEQVFGDEVVKDDNLNKEILAQIVFSDKEKLEKLNSMIHPRVFDFFLNWREKQTSPYVVVESAILFESGWEKSFDKVICINTPLEVAIQRVMFRDSVTRQQVISRMNNQMPLEEKIKQSDYIIFHDNKTMILPQILEIHKQILSI